VKLLEAATATAAPAAVQHLDSAAPATPTLSTVPAPTTSSPDLSALSRPALWVSFADDAEDSDVDSDEVLAPQTPPDVTKTYCGADVPCSADGDGVAGIGTLPLASMQWPPSWVSGADNIDEDSEEELVPRTPPATKTIDLADMMEVDCAAGEHDGWHEVLPRRGPRRPTLSAPAIARRPVPAWLKGRCCRCLAPGHRAVVCCNPFRCSRCLENGHRASDCRNAWRPLSFLEDHVVSSPRQADAPCGA
jgi:hypothetical protein